MRSNFYKDIKLTHFASYLPKQVITNNDIVSAMKSDVSAEVLFRAVGAREKRVALSEEMGSDMLATVGKALLSNSGILPDKINKLICSCDPVDQVAPDSSVLTQHKIGLSCPSFGISMSCVGWLCGIKTAAGLLQNGDNKILVLAASTVGSKYKFNSPMHRAIFGDGAGGALVQKGDVIQGASILAIELLTIGQFYMDIYAPMSWSTVPEQIPGKFRDAFYMNNDNQVFFDALDKYVKPFFWDVLQKEKIQINHIKRFVVHQASMPIFNHTIKSFGIPIEKAANYYEKYGNTIAAELPIYLDMEIRAERIKQGDLVVCFTYGAGFTAGIMVLKF